MVKYASQLQQKRIENCSQLKAQNSDLKRTANM